MNAGSEPYLHIQLTRLVDIFLQSDANKLEECNAPPSWGRHPQTFTTRDLSRCGDQRRATRSPMETLQRFNNAGIFQAMVPRFAIQRFGSSVNEPIVGVISSHRSRGRPDFSFRKNVPTSWTSAKPMRYQAGDKTFPVFATR